VPLILQGGLTPETSRRGVASCGPSAWDVSSGGRISAGAQGIRTRCGGFARRCGRVSLNHRVPLLRAWPYDGPAAIGLDELSGQWHRMFGLMLAAIQLTSPFTVEIEKDLSNSQRPTT